MELFLFGVAIVIAVVLWRSNRRKEEHEIEVMSIQIAEEARVLALKATTPEKLEALEDRYAKAEDNMDLGETPARLYKMLVLKEAVRFANEEGIRYQYCPTLDIDLTKAQTEYAYKILSYDQYHDEMAGIDPDETNWYGLTAMDEPVDVEPEIVFIKKLRTIIDADRTNESKIKSINQLAVKMQEYADNLGLDIYDEDGKVSLGEILKSEGRF